MKYTLDFETANREGADLTEVGAEAYAAHPATEILSLCMLSDDGLGWTWIPGVNDDCLEDILHFANDPSATFEAHNAFFEQMIWHYIMHGRYGMPALDITKWECSLSKALYRGFPPSLEKAAHAANLEHRKDMEGSALTISLSEPETKAAWLRRNPYPGDDAPLSTAEKQQRWGTKSAWEEQYVPGLYDRSFGTLGRAATYCMQDCKVEHELADVTGPLSRYEQRVWELDQRINQRGVRIDAEFVHKAMRIVNDAKHAMQREFGLLTNNLISSQNAKVIGWCIEQGAELPTKRNAAGDMIYTLDKAAMIEMGIGEDANEFSKYNLPPNVRQALEIKAMLGSSSVAKLPRMLQCCGPDGRSRGLIQYHGASTARWAGRLWQPHNLPRPIALVNDGKNDVPPDHDELYAAIMTGSYEFVRMLYGDALKAVAQGLRFAIVPNPGNVLMVGDFAGIEMRADLGVAGQHDKTEMMRQSDTGEKPVDIYLDMAERIYKQPIGSWNVPDKAILKLIKEERVAERTIGKNTVLGCGFQMGGDTFHNKYCPHMTLEFAHDVVGTYRKEFAPLVPKLWYGLEDAAMRAVFNKGTFSSHDITYEFVQEGLHKWIACRLPDGQTMWYYDPHEVRGKSRYNPAQDHYSWHYRAWKDGQWKAMSAYGGLLTENAIQKIARGFLVEAMYRLEAAGYPVVLTVHDEIVCEVPEKGANFKEFREIMKAPTPTSTHYKIPIDVEGAMMHRYRK